MKRFLFLIPVVALTAAGCSAINSLIVHPLRVVHQEHENQEQEEKAYRAEAATNSPTQ